MNKYTREHLNRQEALRKEMEATATAKSELEKERLSLQSKAKFDSTLHQNGSEEDQAMVRFSVPFYIYSHSSFDHRLPSNVLPVVITFVILS